MMGAVTTPQSGVDVVAVAERLAQRLAATGVPHPVAAAVALAARGHHGPDPHSHATQHRLDPDVVATAEAGHLPFDQLPDPLVDWLTPDQLLQLAALDQHYRPGRR